ncbi:hypothetical protein D2E25_0603 [Bifidobacterium goeldii]|uniref:Uncharacterized protein n=1 Tax=Bifidobacterium goeldii TaxID=2306975 RepID=A0A430FN90_9BIFI|nr:hypothetical protein [Bifidobacterium goeldii]RSX54295.1 hypothetical protein D2E25_0603 [Bifidobacterium goeldii]
MPVNKIVSYQRLVENINVKLEDAVRVNVEAEQKMAQTLKRLDAEARAQRKAVAEQSEHAKADYGRVASSLASGPYAAMNVRIPPAVRPVPSNADPQVLEAQQHNLIVQIRSTAEAYLHQKKAEDEAEARRKQAEAEAAARARAAAAAALARRRAMLNQPKPAPEPVKKKPNVALIVGIVVGVVAVIGIAVAVALMM